MDLELLRWWKRLSPVFDPWRELGPSDMERLYQDRPGRPSLPIAEEIFTADDPAEVKVVLCGSRGSGKSTELRRIGWELRHHFVPVLLDAGPAFPRGGGPLPLVILIGLAVLAEARRWSGPGADGAEHHEQAEKKLVERLREAVQKFAPKADVVGEMVKAAGALITSYPDPKVQAVGAAVQAVGGAVAAAGRAAKDRAGSPVGLEGLGRAELTALIPPERMGDARAVVEAVNDAVERLAKLSGRPALLLVEGIDKMGELADVFRVFQQPEILDAVRAPMVFTAPVSLRHSVQASWMPGKLRQVILPNVPVVRSAKGGEARPDPEGVAFMEGVFRRRVEAFRADLDPAEADPLDGIVADADLERLAVASSGVVREFLLLLWESRKAALAARRRAITPEDVTEGIRRRRIALQYALDDQRLAVLRRILARGTRPEGDVAEELLFHNYVACYGNGDLTFRPHEILVDYVRRFGGGEE